MSLKDLYNEYQEAFRRNYKILTQQYEGQVSPNLATPVPPALPPELPQALPTDPKARQDLINLINTYNKQYFATLTGIFASLQNNLINELEALNKKIWMNKNPNWIEPPIEAKPIDCYNDGMVKIDLTTTPNYERELIKLIIPKGFIAVIDRIGNEVESGDEAWDDVAWTIQIDNKFLDSSVEWYAYDASQPVALRVKGKQYNNFHIQLGEINNPCKLSMPFILTEKQIFSIWAINISNRITYYANARVMGWLWIPRTRTSSGYPIEWHLP